MLFVSPNGSMLLVDRGNNLYESLIKAVVEQGGVTRIDRVLCTCNDMSYALTQNISVQLGLIASPPFSSVCFSPNPAVNSEKFPAERCRMAELPYMPWPLHQAVRASNTLWRPSTGVGKTYAMHYPLVSCQHIENP